MDKDGNYESMWNGYKDNTTTLATQTSIKDGKIHLAYTMENVPQVAHSLNGYMTGALFKATYFPDKLQQVAKDGVNTEAGNVNYDNTQGATASELNKIDKSSKGVSFYEFRNILYDSQEAIFIDIINASTSSSGFNYSKFKGEDFKKMTVSEFKQHFSKINEPFGYIEDLNNKIKTLGDETAMSNVSGAQDFITFMADKKEKSFGNARFYKDGVCYYPYWIRHANNGQASVVGIMEYAIVRNNIYDLTVTGMKSLGFSGTEVPDPIQPGEDGTARINVNLFVKNWVVRNNGGIIL